MDLNLADINEAVSAAIGDREAIVFGDRRITYAQLLVRSHQLAHVLLDAGFTRPRRARPARGVAVGPGPPGPVPAQRQRVPGGHVGRLPGPGRALQRQLPLRVRGARATCWPTAGRAASSSTPPSPPCSRRCGPTCRTWNCSCRCPTTPATRWPAGRPLVRGGAGRRAHRPARGATPARRPLHALHRRHHRHAQGRAVAPGRHLSRRARRARDRHRPGVGRPGPDRGERPQRRRAHDAGPARSCTAPPTGWPSTPCAAATPW